MIRFFQKIFYTLLIFQTTQVVWNVSFATTLDGPEDVEMLCSYSDPTPDFLKAEDHSVVLARSKYNYIKMRSELILYPYKVVVEATDLSFVGYDEDASGLRVNTYQPLKITDASFELQLDSLSEIVLPCEKDEAEEIMTAHGLGKTYMVIIFNLISLDDPEQPFCSDTDRPLWKQIDGRVIMAELIHTDNESSLATYRSPRHEEREIRYGPGQAVATPNQHPQIVITRLDMEKDSGLPGAVDKYLHLELKSGLIQCYMKGLSNNAKLQGAMSLRITMDPHGTLQGQETTINTISMDEMTACVFDTIKKIQIPNMPPINGAFLRLTIIFRFESE